MLTLKLVMTHYTGALGNYQNIQQVRAIFHTLVDEIALYFWHFGSPLADMSYKAEYYTTNLVLSVILVRWMNGKRFFVITRSRSFTTGTFQIHEFRNLSDRIKRVQAFCKTKYVSFQVWALSFVLELSNNTHWQSILTPAPIIWDFGI